MKTLQDQYTLIKEGKGHKDVFLKESRSMFPNYIRNASTFDEAAMILKNKGVISENIVGIQPINTINTKKTKYELAFENFLEEARKNKDVDPNAELKKTSQQVEDNLKNNYDNKDTSNPNNQIFGEIMKGYYCEMKDPKNIDKTEEELREIVLKNLAKDPIYYTKNGMFGEKGLGFEVDVPGLGEPVEPKGEFKASGYGDLKEGKINFQDQKYFNDARDLAYGMGLDRDTERQLTSAITTMEIDSKEIQDLHPKFDEDILQLLPTVFAKLDESADELKIRNFINTMVKQEIISENKKYQKTIKEIEKEAKLAEITTKMEALDKAIESKTTRLTSIDESDDLKELVDKKAIKELKKEIKLLEKYKSKVTKMHEKLCKTDKSREIIDEDTIVEADGDIEDTEQMKKDLEDIKSTVDDISKTELFEDEPSESYLEAKKKAEERYDEGEEIEAIIKDFPEHEEMLFQDLKGKYEG